MNPYILGYTVSVLLGVPISWACWHMLHSQVEKRHKATEQQPAERLLWLPLTMGIVERAVYTTLVGFNVSGAASFVGAWVTIKAVGGWATWSKDGSTYTRALFMAGLMSSGVSALMGIAGGIIIALAR